MATVRLLSDEEVRAIPEAWAVFEDIRATRKSDFVNNFWRALANDPPQLRRVWEQLKQVMMADGELSPLVRELIYIAVSTANGCGYCIHSHTAAARAKGMTDGQHAELLAVIGMAAQTMRWSRPCRCQWTRLSWSNRRRHGADPVVSLSRALFPGGVLHLRVFEVRYLDMVRRCIADGTGFGVVALLSGNEVRSPEGLETLAPVGTMARIDPGTRRCPRCWRCAAWARADSGCMPASWQNTGFGWARPRPSPTTRRPRCRRTCRIAPTRWAG